MTCWDTIKTLPFKHIFDDAFEDYANITVLQYIKNNIDMNLN